VAFVALASFISSGSLISENMSPVGVNPILISIVVAAHLLLVMLFMYLYTLIFKKKVSQG